MKTKPLIDYFNGLIPLDEEEVFVVEEVFKERRVRRRQFILNERDVCTHNTFVVKGCFRMYMVDNNAKEHNLQFAIENSWISDIGSFHGGEPSKLYIEAIENSVVLEIKKQDLLRLFIEYSKFNKIFRVITENALVSAQRRILRNISSSAEERYLDFVQRHPNLLNRISNVQIASYLGVTPEFLSSVRRKIAKS